MSQVPFLFAYVYPSLSLPPPRARRPGCCAADGSASTYKSSTTFPDETLTFIKSYPLMDEAVPSVNDQPYFTRTTSRYGPRLKGTLLRFFS